MYTRCVDSSTLVFSLSSRNFEGRTSTPHFEKNQYLCLNPKVNPTDHSFDRNIYDKQSMVHDKKVQTSQDERLLLITNHICWVTDMLITLVTRARGLTVCGSHLVTVFDMVENDFFGQCTGICPCRWSVLPG